MPIHAVISASDYLFMSRFASDEATRFYLQGILLQPRRDGALRMVATDGHVMGILLQDSDNPVLPFGASVLAAAAGLANATGDSVSASGAPGIILAVKPEIVKAAKAKPRVRGWQVYLRLTDSGLEIVSANDPVMAADPQTAAEMTLPLRNVLVDGTFPDWSRVVPSAETVGDKPAMRVDGKLSTSGPLIQSYNPHLLARFAVGADGKSNAAISFASADATSPALVSNTDPRFLGVIMPMRHSGAPADRRADVMAEGDAPAGTEEEKAAA